MLTDVQLTYKQHQLSCASHEFCFSADNHVPSQSLCWQKQRFCFAVLCIPLDKPLLSPHTDT